MNHITIEPTEVAEKGTLLSKRNPKSKRRDTSFWTLDSQLRGEEPLDLQIENLISLIEVDIDALNKIASDCHFEIYCSYFFEYPNSNGMISFDSNLLKRLTAIPIDIAISLYPAEPDEE
ncbi:hypothetical protein BI308_08285 [Roseofilum reptotaenium AO1-A]|uniref:DUF4279 domain-containing protein n=2 Tax=Roseofilum TaxID=1233426 RepID=A0A1L9QTH2_9CYAN|nr:hypothetical protein BI308_08285 [Roseofilum reptotaenium AO1-A]